MGKSNNILFESPHVTIVFRGRADYRDGQEEVLYDYWP